MAVHFTGPLHVDGVPVHGVIPTQGKSIFVKPSTGSDINSGLSADNAIKTLAQAQTLATANQNDVVYLFAESNTASATTDYQSATLDWAKDLVHLVGVGAPVAVSQRSRIAALSTAAAISPLVTFSGDGCIIRNIQIFHGQASASALICAKVTGTRNYFENVHFAGVGDVTQSAAGACSLKIDAGAENVFRHCVIGLDTISRDADATEILFDTNATRNLFEDCFITSYISAAGFASVTVADATGIDRWQIFKNCLFMTDSTNRAVTQDQVFSIPSISQGRIILMNSYYNTDGATGAGVWATTGVGAIWNNSVAAAGAAAGGEMTKL